MQVIILAQEVLMGQSAPENAQLCGSGEGGLRIFEAQQVLPIVQRLVNVGVRFELETTILAA